MFFLKYIDEEDNLAVKEFDSLLDLKQYIKEEKLERTWHNIEEVKKVIPNLKEEEKK